jgi:predicted RecA/RadA family phage recombinase
MKTFVQKGDTMTLAPGADVATGVGFLFGAALFGVAVPTRRTASPPEFQTTGVVTIGKTSALAISSVTAVLGFDEQGRQQDDHRAAVRRRRDRRRLSRANPSATVQMKIGQYLPVAT